MHPEAEDYEYFMRGGVDLTQTLVFVYGTLKKGRGNHHLLASSDFIGNVHTSEKFLLFHCGFPLVRKPTEEEDYGTYYQATVKGEVYRVTPPVLASLDRLEGHPRFYERRVTAMKEAPDDEIWMYHWASSGGAGVIDGGLRAPHGIEGGKSVCHDW